MEINILFVETRIYQYLHGIGSLLLFEFLFIILQTMCISNKQYIKLIKLRLVNYKILYKSTANQIQLAILYNNIITVWFLIV